MPRIRTNGGGTLKGQNVTKQRSIGVCVCVLLFFIILETSFTEYATLFKAFE